MTAETPRSAAPELPTAPASPQVDPEPTPTTNGPLAANLGDRAGVRLTEAEREALARAFASSTRSPDHLAFLAAPVVESLIAARVDAALAPVRELADDFRSDIDWSAGRNNYGDNEAWASAADRLAAALDRQEGHR